LCCKFRFPQGQSEGIARLRIQTAAKGVNGFVKAMRRLPGPLNIRIRNLCVLRGRRSSRVKSASLPNTLRSDGSKDAITHGKGPRRRCRMREPTTIVLGSVPPLRGREKLLDLGIRAAHGSVSVAAHERRRRTKSRREFVTSIMAGTALTETLSTSIHYGGGCQSGHWVSALAPEGRKRRRK
jgi:hypothetical protein